MELAFTFGSVGDIIQLCHLAIRLRRAIGAGCDAIGESAREYQELREELDTLVRILMHVVATYEQYEKSPYLEGLDEVALNVVDQCFGHIKDSLEHFQRRYHTSLHPGGSGHRIRDVFKKVEWTREHDRIKALRAKLRDAIQRLSLIGNLVAETTATVDHKTMLSRIDQVQDIVIQHSYGQTKILNILKTEREAIRDQTKRLEEIKGKLAAQTEQLETQSMQLDDTKQQLVQQNTATWSLFSVAKDALSGILEVKSMLMQVSRDVIRLQAVSANANVGIPVALDPTKDMPVMLEDALGRQVPIPSAWLDTMQWDTLSLLLNDRFASQRGHEMVRNKAYILEESVSGKELDRSEPLQYHLRRGMTVAMSMVFDNYNPKDVASGITACCPRCGVQTNLEEGKNSYCYTTGCNMIWRFDCLLMSSGSIRVIDHAVHDFDPVKARKKPTEPARRPLDEPGDFCRVRLRRPAPRDSASWYCRTCNRPAKYCNRLIVLEHDLVYVAADEGEEDEMWRWNLTLAEHEVKARASSESFDWQQFVGLGSNCRPQDVEWMPEAPSREWVVQEKNVKELRDDYVQCFRD